MIKALAPGMRRGCSWVWLSIAAAGGFNPEARAQPGKPAAEAPAGKEAARAEPDAGDAAPAEEGDAPPKTSSIEVFKDPNAEAALKVFKSVPGLKAAPPSLVNQVRSMAGGGSSLDRDAIARFVSAMAFDLTDKSNINALINPPKGQRPEALAVRAVQRATDNLIDVLQTARLAKNTAFLSAYGDELVATLPKLLDNNLITRVQAMLVLGQAAVPRAVPVYLAQLKNPEQTVWVKLWAARGLATVVENGAKVDTVNVQPIESARTLAELLDGGNDLPWPVQVRLLEALGAMRVSSSPNGLKAEMATTAMKFLADPEARPEVRAQAAWALGMMRVNQTIRNYNYALIAYDIGQVAAELGERINAAFDANRTLSEYLTGLLVTPIYQAFNGLDGARESGLLKVPGGNPSQAFTRQVADLTSAVSKAAVELVRAPGGQVPNRKKDLGDRVASLKAFLEKSSPKDFHLVPNGPEFRPANAQVAEAPVARPGGPVGPGR